MANNVVRFDPFEDMSRLQREMNRLFDDGGQQARWPRRDSFSQSVWAPQVDIHEDSAAITVQMDLPGIKQDDIDIQLTNETLTVTGERKFADDERKQNYVRIERLYGSFTRSFTLGVPVDADKIKASVRDGVLTISLPKSEAVKAKKVAVTSE